MNQNISTKTFNLRPAAESDIDRCWEMLQQGKAQMFREGKKQWTETYPSRQSVENDLARGVAHVLELDGAVVAYGAVIFDGEPAYAQIEDRWLSHGSYVVIHRLAVADEVKRQGVATEFFRQVMHLASTSYNSVAHILYYSRQPVGTNMRMCIGKNRYRCTMLAEDIQYLVNRSTLLASCV